MKTDDKVEGNNHRLLKVIPAIAEICIFVRWYVFKRLSQGKLTFWAVVWMEGQATVEADKWMDQSELYWFR